MWLEATRASPPGGTTRLGDPLWSGLEHSVVIRSETYSLRRRESVVRTTAGTGVPKIVSLCPPVQPHAKRLPPDYRFRLLIVPTESFFSILPVILIVPNLTIAGSSRQDVAEKRFATIGSLRSKRSFFGAPNTIHRTSTPGYSDQGQENSRGHALAIAEHGPVTRFERGSPTMGGPCDSVDQ